MKNKPKFKIFSVFHSKKAQIAVSQAIKVITSIVLGGALLVGGVVTTNQIVLPNTSDKVTSMFGYEGEGGSGGGSISDNIVSSTLNHIGTIPEGGTYQASDGTVYNAGDGFPEVTSGDTYRYGDYVYTLEPSLLSQTGLSSAEEFKQQCESITGMSWTEFIDYSGEQNESDVLEMISLSYMSVDKNYVTSYSKSSYGEILESVNGCTELVIAPYIPDTVRNLQNTFAHCESLTTVPNFPDKLQTMEDAFNSCYNLVNIPADIPNGVVNMSTTFRYCKSLTNAPNLSNNVVNMYGTFEMCESLTTAPTIPNKVTTLCDTFSGCSNLIATPAIPSSVINLEGTFSDCSSLVTVSEILNGVENMDFTFSDCKALVSIPNIPNSVTTMRGTFKNCSSLITSPTIPNGVTNMYETFRGCTNLINTITINANPNNYTYCFFDTEKQIHLDGSSMLLTQIAEASNNNNITVI